MFYKNFICKSCDKQVILLDDDIKDNEIKKRYLSCPYCGSKRIKLENTSDSIKDCMKESAYKRVHGALRQVKNT